MYEDVNLLPLVRWAAGRRPGRFVELGASDGFDGSMTLMLEKCFGWTGVLIEAHPALCKKLMTANRTAHKVCGAVCPRGQTVTMPVESNISGATGTLTVLDFASEEYVKTWKWFLDTTNTVKVPCKPMPDILSEAGILDVDFISIDTQGAEEVVLKTCNMEALTGVVLVEAENTAKAKNVRVRALLARDGFVPIPHVLQQQKKIGGAGYNELFVRKSLVRPAWENSTRSFGGRQFPILYPANTRNSTDHIFTRYDRRSWTARILDGLLAMDEMTEYVQAESDQASDQAEEDE